MRVRSPWWQLAQRREALELPELEHHTPWQEIYRNTVGQLADGGVMDLATKYRNVRRIIRNLTTVGVVEAFAGS